MSQETWYMRRVDDKVSHTIERAMMMDCSSASILWDNDNGAFSATRDRKIGPIEA